MYCGVLQNVLVPGTAACRFLKDTTMASVDSLGNTIDDGCYNCCACWAEIEPGKSWEECCERLGWVSFGVI